jgi:hypothetical protein
MSHPIEHKLCVVSAENAKTDHLALNVRRSRKGHCFSSIQQNGSSPFFGVLSEGG